MRTASPGKQIIQEACKANGLCSFGSTSQLIKRLKTFEMQRSAQMKKNKTTEKNRISNERSSPNSSPDQPLLVSAQDYVTAYCDGDAKQIRNEWVIPPPVIYSKSKTAKWMRADLRGSKAGRIWRWVLACKS